MPPTYFLTAPKRIPEVDVMGQLSFAQQLVDQILSTVKNDDHRLQEEVRASVEKLSSNFPRTNWRVVSFLEIVWPIIMTVIFTITYLFVKSFPDCNGNQPPSPLIHIAVISIGPIVWNAGILVAKFLISLFLGPTLDPTFPKFGSTMAFVAHALGLAGIIGFFEFLVCAWPPSPSRQRILTGIC